MISDKRIINAFLWFAVLNFLIRGYHIFFCWTKLDRVGGDWQNCSKNDRTKCETIWIFDMIGCPTYPWCKFPLCFDSRRFISDLLPPPMKLHSNKVKYISTFEGINLFSTFPFKARWLFFFFVFFLIPFLFVWCFYLFILYHKIWRFGFILMVLNWW